MIHISSPAKRAIRERFSTDDGTAIRVRVAPYGRRCAGHLTITPSKEKRVTDLSHTEDGFVVVADRLLLESIGGIQIGYDPSHWGGGNLTVRPLVNLETGSCGDCRC